MQESPGGLREEEDRERRGELPGRGQEEVPRLNSNPKAIEEDFGFL